MIEQQNSLVEWSAWGMAIKIKMIAGAIVYATSVNCSSKNNQFVKLLIISIIILYDTTVKIITIINNDC